MSRRTIVVIGGALSGPTAAARARETDESARIVLLERSRDISYAVAGLAFHLSGEVKSIDALNRERADFFAEIYGIEVRTGTTVKRIDAARHRVQLQRGSLRYDSLIFAAGAESVIPDVPGLARARNVRRFRTLLDLEAMLEILGRGRRRRRHVAIIGGGFLGIEAADGFLRRRCVVTIIERGPELLPRFTREVSRAAAAALRHAGARLVIGTDVARAQRSRRDVTSLTLAGGEVVSSTDLVVVAAGVCPRTDLLREAGARLHRDGSVRVDKRCRTSLPDVYACGVCLSVPHAVSKKRVWFAQAAQADKTAQVAGTCAAGGRAGMPPVLGTAILRAADLTVARTGLTEAEAGAFAGADLRSVRVHAPSCDPFLSGSRPVSVLLFYHRGNGRLLGAEVAAEAGADKRIDTLAASIAGGLTVDQLGGLDLGYSPPYSAARDPVNVAGTVAAAARAGLARAWTAGNVAEELERLTLVDVRPAAVRKGGSIAGSLSVPLADLRESVRRLSRKSNLVFVSEAGRLGYLAARIAGQRGARDAGYLSGGMRSWRTEGRPVTGRKRARR